MVASKSVEKRLSVQKPAPESVNNVNDVTISLQVGNPVVSFRGTWTTRDVKNILRAIPRAYRVYQSNKRKQGEARYITKETANAA